MKLKINESKSFEFEMDTSGVSWKELQGYFRLTLENVEYGFPVEINKKGVKVNIPVIKDVLHESVRSSLYEHKEVTVKARLDLIANNEVYIKPWSGNIDIEIPVSVKLMETKKDVRDAKVMIVDPDVKEHLEEDRKDRKSKFLDALVKLDLNESGSEKTEKIEENQDDKEIDEKKAKKKSKFSEMLT
jgi:hypothetical protein